MSKTLVFFHFYEANEIYLKNLLHFLYFGYSKYAHYEIIIADKCSVHLPSLDNVSYINVQNKNWDYGGYCQAIATFKDKLDYDYYFFVNCSVRGPFLPPYLNISWFSLFTDLMIDNVGLVGATINKVTPASSLFKVFTKRYACDSADHVQTSVYAMNNDVFQYLFAHGFYNIQGILTRDQVIENYEVLLSKLVSDGGWRIRCLLPEFEITNMGPLSKIASKTSHEGDIFGPKRYFGRTPHPYETMFVKTNRALFTDDYLDRLAHSMYYGGIGFKKYFGFNSFYIDELLKISMMDKEIEITPIPRTRIKKLQNSIKKRIKKLSESKYLLTFKK